jgi:hypothetical protein
MNTKEPNDLDVAQIVREAGEETTAAFRAELRSTLQTALADANAVPQMARVVSLADRRRRRMLVSTTLVAAAAAAVVVGLVVVTGQREVTTPATTSVTPTIISSTTTGEPTTLPATSSTTTVPRVDPSTAIDIETGAAFGLVPGEQVVVNDFRTRVEALNGPADHDTGWYMVPPNTDPDGIDDCLGGTYRVLWWGDMAMRFVQLDGDSGMLNDWTLGDHEAKNWLAGLEPSRPATSTPTGFTVGGIGIGSAESEIASAFPGRFGPAQPLELTDQPPTVVYQATGGDPAWPELAPEGAISVAIIARDGLVIGIDANRLYC